ncbi:hypothetical protein LWI29_027643 [Acer saccharum]|uniref:Uncharacterized protein n=2 Tax=Acer TaxID=4022 RepID=A0A5C7HDR2_9ROSI|nr:hypothetical protein LWI29_027643 [Acer saccharum]KAK1567859.1 hypothetical protein Q3G72_017546 [Acer saccharum]TXG55144.1 hypothetical protein EZV62_020400 [Acer yangbiense]
MAKNPVSRENSDDIARFLEGTASFADVVFGFTDDSDESEENLRNYEDGDENSCNVEENKAFWENQEQLLQATVCRTSSSESKVRQATKEALKEINLVGAKCVCRRPVAGGCRDCLRREISIRLQNVGYDCAICKSKWRSSSEIPSGAHTYLEVLDKVSSKKGEVIRILIELNFRAEFEMARASEEYNKLISRLPDLFVGKTERLKTLIKILCLASKKCMKEKKMHLGPWRKHKYMQAKWFGTYERITPVPLPVKQFSETRQAKPRAYSMLTFDLLENLHCSAVEVL